SLTSLPKAPAAAAIGSLASTLTTRTSSSSRTASVVDPPMSMPMIMRNHESTKREKWRNGKYSISCFLSFRAFVILRIIRPSLEIKPEHGDLRFSLQVVGFPFGGGNVVGTDAPETLAFEKRLGALLGRAGEHVGEVRAARVGKDAGHQAGAD